MTGWGRDFSLWHCAQTGSGTRLLLGKAVRLSSLQLCLCSVEVNAWSFTSISPYFFMACCTQTALAYVYVLVEVISGACISHGDVLVWDVTVQFQGCACSCGLLLADHKQRRLPVSGGMQ